MVPQATPRQTQTQALPPARSDSAFQPLMQLAAAETPATQPGLETNAPLRAPVLPPAVTVVSVPVKETKAAVPVVRRIVNRPGYMLNESQIASIKHRLHLTPDQERMWPTVEAALRNMAYTHAHDARTHNGATDETASVDPESVQGLKSAAVPLILSFNSEQKEEVRNLVHVMGLDQLATQF
jgi:hypothetical protein